jgi:hypothetical protein
MGAFDATNTQNPLFSDPPYQSCCQFHFVSGEEELPENSTRSKGSAKGDTQL